MRNASKIVVGLVLVAGSVTPAAALAEVPGADPDGKFCVVEAVAAGRAPTAPASPTCFATFARAVAFATDGTVRLAPHATSVNQRQLDAGKALDASATTVIGIEYEHTTFGGTQWIFVQSSGCNDGGTEVWMRADLTGTSMDDEISAARTYGGCRSRHFDNPGFGGSSYLCGCSQMGGMSDQTTSIRWSASGY